MNDTRYFEPIMGKGRYRGEGQKILNSLAV